MFSHLCCSFLTFLAIFDFFWCYRFVRRNLLLNICIFLKQISAPHLVMYIVQNQALFRDVCCECKQAGLSLGVLG